MGGLLFKTGRIPANKYYDLVAKLETEYLFPKFGKFYNIPASIKDKKDFGDVDINISRSIITPNWGVYRESIVKDLNLNKGSYKFVSNVLSVLYDNFQVDFFARQAKHFESAYNFQSYNCLGNLIGKTVKRLEMKFSEEGLFFVYRRDNGKDNHYKSQLLLSRDMNKICDFLGLDYAHWVEGFTYQEMFYWFTKNKFFVVDPFLKISDTDRFTMQEFKNFCLRNDLKTKNSIALLHYDEKITELNILLQKFFNINLLEFINKEKEKERENKIIKEKFNGKIIINATGLRGKPLGQFISCFKNQFENESEFKKFIIDSDVDTVYKKIVSTFRHFSY